MKKPVALLLGMIMIFSLAACAGTNPDTPFGTMPNSNSQMTTNGTNDTKKPDSITSGAIGTISVTDPTVTTEPTDTPTAKGKTLVVYFSWSSSGNTEKIAKRIVEATGADLVKIEAAEPYIGSYNDVAYGRAKDEHDTNARPEVAASIYAAIDMGRYDTVFIGYPIWWWTTPMIIATFLEHYEWSADVNIYPFSQSASMNAEQFATSVEQVKTSAAGATVHDGLFASANNTNAIDKYLKDNGFTD